MTVRERLAARCPGPCAAVVLATLAIPGTALAADERIAGPAVASAAGDPATWSLAIPDPGPLLLLMVAVALGVLARLAGPEPGVAPRSDRSTSSSRSPERTR